MLFPDFSKVSNVSIESDNFKSLLYLLYGLTHDVKADAEKPEVLPVEGDKKPFGKNDWPLLAKVGLQERRTLELARLVFSYHAVFSTILYLNPDSTEKSGKGDAYKPKDAPIDLPSLNKVKEHLDELIVANKDWGEWKSLKNPIVDLYNQKIDFFLESIRKLGCEKSVVKDHYKSISLTSDTGNRIYSTPRLFESRYKKKIAEKDITTAICYILILAEVFGIYPDFQVLKEEESRIRLHGYKWPKDDFESPVFFKLIFEKPGIALPVGTPSEKPAIDDVRVSKPAAHTVKFHMLYWSKDHELGLAHQFFRFDEDWNPVDHTYRELEKTLTDGKSADTESLGDLSKNNQFKIFDKGTIDKKKFRVVWARLGNETENVPSYICFRDVVSIKNENTAIPLTKNEYMGIFNTYGQKDHSLSSGIFLLRKFGEVEEIGEDESKLSQEELLARWSKSGDLNRYLKLLQNKRFTLADPFLFEFESNKAASDILKYLPETKIGSFRCYFIDVVSSKDLRLKEVILQTDYKQTLHVKSNSHSDTTDSFPISFLPVGDNNYLVSFTRQTEGGKINEHSAFFNSYRVSIFIREEDYGYGILTGFSKDLSHKPITSRFLIDFGSRVNMDETPALKEWHIPLVVDEKNVDQIEHNKRFTQLRDWYAANKLIGRYLFPHQQVHMPKRKESDKGHTQDSLLLANATGFALRYPIPPFMVGEFYVFTYFRRPSGYYEGLEDVVSRTYIEILIDGQVLQYRKEKNSEVTFLIGKAHYYDNSHTLEIEIKHINDTTQDNRDDIIKNRGTSYKFNCSGKYEAGIDVLLYGSASRFDENLQAEGRACILVKIKPESEQTKNDDQRETDTTKKPEAEAEKRKKEVAKKKYLDALVGAPKPAHQTFAKKLAADQPTYEKRLSDSAAYLKEWGDLNPHVIKGLIGHYDRYFHIPTVPDDSSRTGKPSIRWDDARRKDFYSACFLGRLMPEITKKDGQNEPVHPILRGYWQKATEKTDEWLEASLVAKINRRLEEAYNHGFGRLGLPGLTDEEKARLQIDLEVLEMEKESSLIHPDIRKRIEEIWSEGGFIQSPDHTLPANQPAR